MLLFAKEYPSHMPSTPDELTRWKARLQHEADSIQAEICELLGANSRRRLPITKFLASSTVKEWLADPNKQLPSNTPEQMVIYFKKSNGAKKKKSVLVVN